ncbi:MAG: GGDEF domain-containing protein [Scytonematopsis contorta HA4267-MV1]|jgi:diguanylate cyclase (GGDEF)-like protein|nr:GGDEF domain-containing protein [Scytonematopsis contorta HA4267-MV1]
MPLPKKELRNLQLLNQRLQTEIHYCSLQKLKSSSFEIQVRNLLTAIDDIIVVLNVCGEKLQNIEILPTKIQGSNKNVGLIDKMLELFLLENIPNIWLSKIQQSLSSQQTLNFDYSLLLESDEIWFSVSIYPISENSIIWIARDISERILVEKALQNSEAQLRQKINHLEQLLEEAQNLANLDGLTKIANRYCFNNYMHQKWGYIASKQSPIAFILLDVDYFKLYNDAYGHLAGDACLVKIANAIRSVIKPQSHFVARYGGEEFSVILLYTDERGAAQVAQLIIEQIKQLNIPHALSQVADIVTVSMGIAVLLPNVNNSPQDLIHKADQALYQAKKEGRNRYYCIQ